MLRRWIGSYLFRVLDSFFLLVLIVLQNVALNRFLIEKGGWNKYGWFYLGDGILIVVFVIALIISYRFILHKLHAKIDKLGIDIPHIEIPMYGVLPFGYITWFIYSSYLAAKVIIIFNEGIAANLKPEGFWSSSLLKVVLAATAGVFILLVNTHHDAEPNSDRNNYIADLCKGTTFDIMDSVSFVSILFYQETHMQLHMNAAMENAILAFASMNFVLPTLGLIKLSFSDFGEQRQPLKISLLYKSLKLLLINLPYMIVRLMLWEADTGVSMFLMKNIFACLVTLRYMVPEIIFAYKSKHKVAGVDNLEIRPI